MLIFVSFTLQYVPSVDIYANAKKTNFVILNYASKNRLPTFYKTE